MRSMGRYGPSPFLVGQYGGLGEIAQGFCRTSAVSGTTYILGRNVLSYSSSIPSAPSESIPQETSKFIVELDDFDERLKCDILIASPGYLPQQSLDQQSTEPSSSHTQAPRYAIARCIAIIDRRIHFPTEQASGSAEVKPTPDDDAMDSKDLEEEVVPPTKIVDTALVVFPPESLQTSPCSTAVHAFITGEGSMSTPKDRCMCLTLWTE